MSTPLPNQPRGFSLSAKVILMAVSVEIVLIAGGLFFEHRLLSNKSKKQTETALLTQVELIAKEIEVQKDKAPQFQLSTLELNPQFIFQVIDLNGHVFWDSKNSKRIHTQLVGHHPIFDEAKGNEIERKAFEFQSSSTHEEYIGAYQKSLGQYLVMGAVATRETLKSTYEIIEKLFLLSLLFCGLSFLLIVFLSRRIIRPIHDLTIAAKKMAQGEFDVAIAPTSSGEIGVLSDAFTSMARKMRELLKEEVQKVRIKQEVNVVAQLQQSLLPRDEIKTPQYEIQSYYQSATETGGDYWGYFETHDHLVLYVGDATGHGLSSAMLTAAARGCFSAMHRLMMEHPEIPIQPSHLLRYVNEAIMDCAQAELNMTMFVAMYSFHDQVLSYANAGHNPAWIVRNETGKSSIEVLSSMGPRLGESKLFETPANHETVLAENDILFLYTDGLLDCMNAAQVSYGKERARSRLTTTAQSQLNLSMLKSALIHEVKEFTESKPLRDDITFALFKMKPSWERELK